MLDPTELFYTYQLQKFFHITLMIQVKNSHNQHYLENHLLSEGINSFTHRVKIFGTFSTT